MVNKPEKSANIHKQNMSDTFKKAIGISIISLLSLNTPSIVSGENNKSSIAEQELVEQKQTYEECLQKQPSEMSEALVKKTMLHKLNDIRKQHQLKPLKYNKQLDNLALQFATEKNETERWKDQWMHFDKDSLGVIERSKKAGIWKTIKEHVVDHEIMGLGENLVSTNGSIEAMVDALMKSPGHRRRILCPYVTETGFGYTDGYTILVQIFADFKKN